MCKKKRRKYSKATYKNGGKNKTNSRFWMLFIVKKRPKCNRVVEREYGRGEAGWWANRGENGIEWNWYESEGEEIKLKCTKSECKRGKMKKQALCIQNVLEKERKAKWIERETRYDMCISFCLYQIVAEMRLERAKSTRFGWNKKNRPRPSKGGKWKRTRPFWCQV